MGNSGKSKVIGNNKTGKFKAGIRYRTSSNCETKFILVVSRDGDTIRISDRGELTEHKVIRSKYTGIEYAFIRDPKDGMTIEAAYKHDPRYDD